MSVPGQLIQWISMFEDTKVDADLAYWTHAGDLDDHGVRTRQANGGWWLLKWYADLTGRPSGGPAIALGGGARATFFVAAGEDGYHDLTLSYRSDRAGDLDVREVGRAVPGVRAARPGDGASRLRVHLPAGISKVEVGGPAGLRLREPATVHPAHPHHRGRRPSPSATPPPSGPTWTGWSSPGSCSTWATRRRHDAARLPGGPSCVGWAIGTPRRTAEDPRRPVGRAVAGCAKSPVR
ncbi:hypothetical protein HD597_002758 [Nonomuraea thailandensis]|uniref:Uncharacterized protein n=1 Tax=Nonomuraea thailandensis TaxID=1188745 RepID=A0A9X2GK81_9ACTN|nr:hypothetical protein [Nonomuraea thailandensis]MCP2355738.1 hypothetical protein [Nonomuraea thailandensis]